MKYNKKNISVYMVNVCGEQRSPCCGGEVQCQSWGGTFDQSQLWINVLAAVYVCKENMKGLNTQYNTAKPAV